MSAGFDHGEPIGDRRECCANLEALKASNQKVALSAAINGA